MKVQYQLKLETFQINFPKKLGKGEGIKLEKPL